MIYLRVPASLAYRDVVMRVVFGACKVASAQRADAGLSTPGPEVGEHIVSAVGEAFNNVVFHAYRGRTVGDIAFEVEITDEALSVRVVDFGSAFDPTVVPEPDLDELPESGMGLFIMKRFMDTVRYEAGPPNSLLLTKRF